MTYGENAIVFSMPDRECFESSRVNDLIPVKHPFESMSFL